MTGGQIETLKANFGTLSGIDPCTPAYRKLVAMLDAMPQNMLKQIAGANIKFVSQLAFNRIKR